MPALARCIAYQALRLRTWVRTWNDEETDEFEIPPDADVAADQELRARCQAVQDERPLNVVLADLEAQLDQTGRDPETRGAVKAAIETSLRDHGLLPQGSQAT